MTKVQKHCFFTKKSLLHLSYNSVFFTLSFLFYKKCTALWKEG